MEITKARLREIITEEISKMAEAQDLSNLPRPWEDDYAKWDKLAGEARATATTAGDSSEAFDAWMVSMESADKVGVYHRLMSTGGADPMPGMRPGDPEYVDWRDRPQRDPISVKMAMYIRSSMTPDEHTLRREMTAPPAPERTTAGTQYANHEAYFQAEASEELKQVADEFGGDESGTMQKYVYNK
tara:strand:- start:3445 stop:4002 length:558 start_codon:yes stop_codon:yes gene_type:complete